MSGQETFGFTVGALDETQRLDAVVTRQVSGCSRSYAGKLIRLGAIRVDGEVKKPGYRVRAGEVVRGHIPSPEPIDAKPENIPLDILFEDDHIIVVNKPAGLVVHPAPGHYSGTLVNALLFHCPDLQEIGGAIRPGIVHRLDKDTSGAIVAAKNDPAHQQLSRQFKSRSVRKRYLALVCGAPDAIGGEIDLPIGRHPVDRKKMSVSSKKSRNAETQWRVKARFGALTLLEVRIKTGRTHQIRVHCAAMHHPVVGDRVYGSAKMEKHMLSQDIRLKRILGMVKRHMLHAWKLRIVHPINGREMAFVAPLTADIASVISELKKNTAAKTD